jgi:hypothetical protein
MGLIVGQAVSIAASDFRKLTGYEITEFASEGRFMMENLAAKANCALDTSGRTAVFTKNPGRPMPGVWPSSAHAGASADWYASEP